MCGPWLASAGPLALGFEAGLAMFACRVRAWMDRSAAKGSRGAGSTDWVEPTRCVQEGK